MIPLSFVGLLDSTSGIVAMVVVGESGSLTGLIGAKAWDSGGTDVDARDSDDELNKGNCKLEHTVGKDANDEENENIPESLHECLDIKEVKPII